MRHLGIRRLDLLRPANAYKQFDQSENGCPILYAGRDISNGILVINSKPKVGSFRTFVHGPLDILFISVHAVMATRQFLRAR